jgi:hypothetical protein
VAYGDRPQGKPRWAAVSSGDDRMPRQNYGAADVAAATNRYGELWHSRHVSYWMSEHWQLTAKHLAKDLRSAQIVDYPRFFLIRMMLSMFPNLQTGRSTHSAMCAGFGLTQPKSYIHDTRSLFNLESKT